ncbi:MAG: hypothetical protein BMS9Abin10_0173 [Gammaproteobacteria bacterium]|nr:MAG: hypothetical protein BMS9Abin10_0173 [Gammaproteobacteria bacterium]
MNGQNRSKINRLLEVWPRGTVAVHAWLREQHVYRQLASVYRKTEWLKAIGRGAFAYANDHVDWIGGLYAIQAQLGLSIHPGGKTALGIQGYAHFLPLGQGAPVYLFGVPGERLPAWFKQYQWGATLVYSRTQLFRGESKTAGLTNKDMDSYSVVISSPERAAMEMLHLVPQKQSFQEARLLMEGLTTLRPHMVQSLLEKCQSVKVKRLFMFLSEECGHAWVGKVDLSRVNFGRGKRMLVKGGRFDAKYGITVPQTYADSSVTQKAGMPAMAQAGGLPIAAGENAGQYPAMTKAQGVAFKARWARVEAAERDELRATSIDQKLRQLAALMASVAKLGWNEALAAEEIQAREQWQRLRQAYGV